MPSKRTSPRTLDLFERTLTIGTPLSGLPARLPWPRDLTSQSDAELAQQLGHLIAEVKRRLEEGKGAHLELVAASQQALQSLESPAPVGPRQTKRLRPRKPSSLLQTGQRKAVRAALQAGVAPSQIAKHFGLSLAAVRKVVEEIA